MTEDIALEYLQDHLPGVEFSVNQAGKLQLEGMSIRIDDLFTHLGEEALRLGVIARGEYLCDLVRLHKLQQVTHTLSPELDALLAEERQLLQRRVGGFRSGSIYSPRRLAHTTDPAGLTLYRLQGEYGDYQAIARYDDDICWFTLEEQVTLPGMRIDTATMEQLARKFPDCEVTANSEGVWLDTAMCAPMSGLVGVWLKGCRSGLRQIASRGIPGVTC